eukprot:2019389-Amphidinium_carterae.1
MEAKRGVSMTQHWARSKSCAITSCSASASSRWPRCKPCPSMDMDNESSVLRPVGFEEVALPCKAFEAAMTTLQDTLVPLVAGGSVLQARRCGCIMFSNLSCAHIILCII